MSVLEESGRLASNNLTPGYTTLAAAITASGATTISVTTYAGFPASGNYYVMIDAEQLQVTAGQGTATWTVVRGTNGTTAATHLVDTYVFQSATTVIPIMPTFFEPILARYNPALMRDSFESFYESIIVSQHSEIKGVKIPATYEVLTWLLSWAVAAATPTVSGSVATWPFSPNLTADDLQGAGAEFYTDTAAYHIAGLYCDQLVIENLRGTDSAQVTIDMLGQQAFLMGGKTPAITTPISPVDTELNLINPAYTKSYLDTTTIGTTLSNDLSSWKLTIANKWKQLFFLNGILSPTGVARPTRTAAIEYIKWFDDNSELTAFMNTVGNGTKRKLRMLSTGPEIGTSGTNNSLQIDWYGYLKTGVFKADSDAVWFVTFAGDSVYEPSPGNSWSLELINGILSLT